RPSAGRPRASPAELPLRSLSSTVGLNSGQTEAQAGVLEPRRAPVPVRRPRDLRDDAPAPAPDHPVRGRSWPRRIDGRRPLVITGIVPIPTPLPDVAVHVVQAKGVRLLLPDRVRLTARVGRIPCILAQCVLVIAEGKPRRGPRPAGIFPLRLGGETIAVAASDGDRIALDAIVRFPDFPLAQLVAEPDCVQPGDLFNWQVFRSLEVAGVRAHHRLVLT